MTPEQRAVLGDANGGDLVLIATPSIASSTSQSLETTQPEYSLLLIDSIRTTDIPTDSTIYLRTPTSLSPEDWLKYCRDPSYFWTDFRSSEFATPLDNHISPTSEIILRPSFDDLHHTHFYGTCPWMHCTNGLVVLNNATRAVLRSFADSAVRCGMKGLCPFCMGVALYRDHEELIGRWWGELGAEIMEEHIERIHARKLELGYGPLGEVRVLADLRSEEAEVAREERRADGGAAGDIDVETQQHATGQAGSALATTADTVAGAESGPSQEYFRQAWFAHLDGSAARTEISHRMSEAAIAEMRRFTADSGRSSVSRSMPALTLPPPAITNPVQTAGPVIPNLRVSEWYVKATVRVHVGISSMLIVGHG